MTLIHETIKQRFNKEHSTPALVAAEIYMCLALGVVLILGGVNRISAPAFMYIKESVDWSPFNPNLTWGFVFLFLVVMQTASLKFGLQYLVYTLRLSTIPFAIWSVLIAQAATTPQASLTGIVMYSMGFVIIWVISLVVSQSPSERQNQVLLTLVEEAERRVLNERNSITESPNNSA